MPTPATNVDRSIEYMLLADLRPDPRNPKEHDVPAIMALLRRGVTDVVAVIDERTGKLIAGHGRRMALLEMEATALEEGDASDGPPPGIRLADDGRWLVPVGRGWSSKDAKEARTYLVGLNQLTIAGGWNRAALYSTVAGLDAAHLAGTGFTLADVTALRSEFGPQLPPPTDDDFDPTPPADPVSAPGDRWQLGPHVLVCGSATDPACYPASADLVWTDPPYGIDYAGGPNPTAGIPRDKIEGDLDLDAARALQEEAFPIAMKACRPGACWWVAAPPGTGLLVPMTILDRLGILRHSYVWLKSNHTLCRSDYHYQHEALLHGWTDGAEPHQPEPVYDEVHQNLLYGWTPGAAHHPQTDRRRSSVFEYDKPTRSTEHPTMKPVPLIGDNILAHTDPGELVLDMFGGSGSTLVAAHQTGRLAWLIEKDRGYCDVIALRYQRLTGDVPRLNGEPHPFT